MRLAKRIWDSIQERAHRRSRSAADLKTGESTRGDVEENFLMSVLERGKDTFNVETATLVPLGAMLCCEPIFSLHALQGENVHENKPFNLASTYESLQSTSTILYCWNKP